MKTVFSLDSAADGGTGDLQHGLYATRELAEKAKAKLPSFYLDTAEVREVEVEQEPRLVYTFEDNGSVLCSCYGTAEVEIFSCKTGDQVLIVRKGK